MEREGEVFSSVVGAASWRALWTRISYDVHPQG